MLPEKRISALLRKKNKTVALAESCSGGLLSHRITNIPGSSEYFIGSVVAYSNKAKVNLLKITPKLIAQHGAVSNQIAKQMAKGVRRLFQTDFGVSITGIAGPGGGTKTKPVGLTYIAVNSRAKTICVKSIFKGTRLSIKSQAASKALELLLRHCGQKT